jgi:UDP-N-acetylmuramate dehydrogenase
VDTILHSIKNINIAGNVEFDRALAEFTTFKVGGPADILAFPTDESDVRALLDWARSTGTPWMILGGGANVLVSDRGVRGLVIATAGLNHIRLEGGQVVAGSGSAISDVSAYAADRDLAGLDFIYSMPGSTGGAVWMNARCYGGEISEILAWVDYLDLEAPVPDDGSWPLKKRLVPSAGDFAYKISPFQSRRWIILDSAYRLEDGRSEDLWRSMKGYEADRRSKGHFHLPCAGSVFKNNREFGAPSGKIIDSLGMRGTAVGGAKISDSHANIIVNSGSASAADIRELIELIHSRVIKELGYDLEAEVLMIGDWES